MVEEVHGFLPGDSHRLHEALIDEHGYLRAVDDARYLAAGGVDHGDVDDALVMHYGRLHLVDVIVDGAVDKVYNFSVLSLLGHRCGRGDIFHEAARDVVGA